MGVAILPHRVLQQGSKLPEYTYTGSHQLIDDGGGNWRIKFLTSGTLTFKRKPKNIDVFLVGGGASGGSSIFIEEKDSDYDDTYNTTTLAVGGGPGGGGGRTKTQKNVSVSSNVEYSIVVGSGGASVQRTRSAAWDSSGKRMFFTAGKTGGTSSAFGYSAVGGGAGYAAKDNYSYGGSGGSGGGGMQIPYVSDYYYGQPLTGGSDGGNSTYTGTVSITNPPTTYAGKGQGTNTREFGEPSAVLYAGGGGSGNDYYGHVGYDSAAPGGSGGGGAGGYRGSGIAGSANTGGGGGGAGVAANSYYMTSGAGGSGIVIIRNAR